MSKYNEYLEQKKIARDFHKKVKVGKFVSPLNLQVKEILEINDEVGLDRDLNFINRYWEECDLPKLK